MSNQSGSRRPAARRRKKRIRRSGLIFRVKDFIYDRILDAADAISGLVRGKSRGRDNNRSGGSRRGRSNNSSLRKILAIGGTLVFTALLVMFVHWYFTHKNAFEISVNGVAVGCVKDEKTVTVEDIRNQLDAKLKSEHGDKNYEINDIITRSHVRAAANKLITYDSLINSIYINLTYQQEAWAIMIDDIQYAVLETKEQAEGVLERIKSQYASADSVVVSSKFLENVECASIFIDVGGVSSEEEAERLLKHTREELVPYTVVDGDNLLRIASKHGITLEALLGVNPDTKVEVPVKIGQVLNVSRSVPLLSVETVISTETEEIEKKETIIEEDPTQPATYKKIVRQGRDGQKKIVRHITRVNGLETSSEVVETITTVEPVTEIIAVGTKVN